MKLSSEQTQIVQTVVHEFLPVICEQLALEEALGIVLKCVEQKASQATARGELLMALAEIGQRANGELLDLCVATANNLVNGYASWVNSWTDVDEYPASQLYDAYNHVESIDWLRRWRANGGLVFARNEMIALKNDSIWTRISFFGLPFPPFELESGMDVDGIPRNEAEKLGLISPGQEVEPMNLDLNFGPALRQRLNGVKQ